VRRLQPAPPHVWPQESVPAETFIRPSYIDSRPNLLKMFPWGHRYTKDQAEAKRVPQNSTACAQPSEVFYVHAVFARCFR
jgi:hypothetical protein